MKIFKTLEELISAYKQATGNQTFRVKTLNRFEMGYLFEIDSKGYMIENFGFVVIN